ncbi:PREDICTED: zinc finger CCCH domain-containing protein 44-like [Fragaria vesca subsp. vesca]|uniref:zinc finger CCCH domain-containing protein 44-like n=1 Tax=Fragaria vesca subsp. vesca TaxID=101020 RepID=UPI0002C35104|nr:PREDICTED: zinc finger CCCH domain-containing protein 44-like [Fragaria vesca subsp. vesca]XP_011459086.1 PREDICTED: zinc finger CCCH domain-containing protein 44-like [Fragaria vesca subsp. vesca]
MNDKDLDEVEDWCFVCKDGGALRVCDYRGCTKVYHAKCVHKTNSFLKTKKRWVCDHHSCSVCHSQIEISFSCLLCTYSVCDNCRKSNDSSEFAVVRGKENVGLCVDCLELVRFAENAECDRDGDKLDFEDPETFEYGFKECWEILKEKDGLTLNDIYDERREMIHDEEISLKELLMQRLNKQKSDFDSKEKPENVVSLGSHMNAESGIHKEDGDETTQIDHVLCKHNKRKLILDCETSSESEKKEPHVENGMSEDYEDNIPLKDRLARRILKKPKLVIPHYVKPFVSVEKEPHVENSLSEDDEDITLKDCLARRLPKKPKLVIPSYVKPFVSEEKKKVMYHYCTRNAKESCFASVVVSNMKLVYLRRSLVEELMSTQPDNWERKVVGSYVRVENDLDDYFQGNSSYQLTQVKGITRKQNSGEILLHLLARDVLISSLSDCDFTEEECRNLQEMVENHLVRRPTVVEIEHKARQLHEDIKKDWIEREFLRLETCIRSETNQYGWISTGLSKYIELREMLKQTLEQGKLLHEEPQIITDVLSLSDL